MYMLNKGIKFYILLGLLSVIAFLFYVFIPVIRFEDPYSTVVYARDGSLLGARISKDGQWRFPPPDSLPQKFEKALLLYEDKRFYLHRGLDVISLARALRLNLTHGQIRSGGSTLTMQLARMFGHNPSRNLWNKMYEMLLALRLEGQLNKMDILRMYSANAPFGGNIIGLETAAWRYFGKGSRDLTWAEVATLAVLPNSPGLIHPGRNRAVLKTKRDRLLLRLFDARYIDDITLELSMLEELPGAPRPLPEWGDHLVDHLVVAGYKGQSIHSSIDLALQEKILRLAERYRLKYSQNGIRNMGILVTENATGQVLAYIGNTGNAESTPNYYVDMVQAGRSSGSILKPLLYAAAIDEGLISNRQLLPDIPGRISGFRPRNFNRDYEGAVPADRALARSLNVPAVYLLQSYSLDKFYLKLKSLGFSGLDKPAEYYGLPLILGGADVSLWELSGIYSSMARVLTGYAERDGLYADSDFFMPVLNLKETVHPGREGRWKDSPGHFSAGAIWQCFTIMRSLERPDQLGRWERYANPLKLAWKTGTSYGFRDAWSVGVNPRFTVGVWVGNASGESRPELTGIKAAAPVLFDVFNLLPGSEWFEEPADDLKYRPHCKESGYPAGPKCTFRDTLLVPYRAAIRELCPYHETYRLDPTGRYNLPEGCNPDALAKVDTRFVLPPLMEYYYARAHPEYQGAPPDHPDCLMAPGDVLPMAFIYPAERTKVLIPVEFSGQQGRVVFKLVHRDPAAKVFWYIDEALVATTIEFHELELWKAPGTYRLMAIDDKGNRIRQNFDVVE